MKRVGYLWVLIAFCLFTSKPSLAWWTVLYPETAGEASIEEPYEEQESETLEIKWKFMEWLEKWF